MIAGKKYAVAPEGRIGVWHMSKELRKVGAALEIWFDEPCWIEYDWPVLEWNEEEHGWPPYRELTYHQAVWVERLRISVNLEEERVVQIAPFEAR